MGSITSAVTVGDLIDARLRITQPWYRVFARRNLVRRWSARLSEALGRTGDLDVPAVQPATEVARLGPLERAVTLAAVAIAERPVVLMLERADRAAAGDDDARFLAAVILVPLAFAGLFVGALLHGDDALDAIPAAVVNQDQLIYQNAADGTKTPVFAGRQLVTELTKAGSGFNWSVSNAHDAGAALRTGAVDAVLTIPKDFSKSILSLSSDAPRRADLAIRTDDAHSYLTGVVAQSVGSSMVDTFGKTITERYISGISAGVGDLGTSLGTAAAGAGTLADAASSLSGGLSTLTGGVASLQGSASSLASGVNGYTRGVDSLSGGLAKRDGAAGLTGVSNGVADYTARVAQLSQQLTAANEALKADPTDPVVQARFNATVAGISGYLSQAAAGGPTLAQQASGAISGIQGAIASSASGAAKLSAGSAGLRSGASSLASGLTGIGTGAATASSGAGQLAVGGR